MRLVVVIAGVALIAATIVHLYLRVDESETAMRAQAQRIEELEARNAELAAAVKRDPLKWYDPLPPDTPPQPDHQGRVLAVREEAKLCVISLGEDDGVKKGFQYIVSRGSEYVTSIQITDVQKSQSAGRELEGMRKSAPRTGDAAMSGR